MFLSASSYVFSSSTRIAMFSKSSPWQLPQAATQVNPFLRHEQMRVLQGCLVVVYICNKPLGVANPELLEDLSLQGQQNYSATSNLSRVDNDMSNPCVSIVQPAGRLSVHDSKLPFLLAADFPAQTLFGLQPWPCILNAASAPVIQSFLHYSYNWIELFRNVIIKQVEYLINSLILVYFAQGI